MGRRIASVLVLLLAVSFVAYMLADLASGNQASYLLGDYADEESVAALNAHLGTSENPFVGYLSFMKDFFLLDWGYDVKGTAISSLVLSRFSVTLELTLLSLCLSIVFSLVTAVTGVHRSGAFLDVAGDILSIVIFSLPSFLLSILLIVVVSGLPSGGFVPVSVSLSENLRHMLLPVLSTSLMHSALLSRVLKNSLRREARQPYVTTSIAKGRSGRKIVSHVILRPSLPPYLALLSQSFGAMMAGSAVTESVFALPGLGSLFVSAALSRDIRLAVTLIMLFFLFVSFSSIVSEIAMSIADPRIRRDER